MCVKNAGVGVGIPDTGRVKLIVEDDEKLHIYSGASCIGQGLGTVLVQMVVTNTDLKHEDIVYEEVAMDLLIQEQHRDRADTGHRRSLPQSMRKNDGKTVLPENS